MTSRPARLAAILPALFLAAAAPQPPAAPADKPAAPTQPTLSAPAAPLTDAEKPLVGRWTLDRPAAVAAIKKARASDPDPRIPTTDEEIGTLLDQTVGGISIDLRPDRTARVAGPGKVTHGSWSLKDNTLTITGWVRPLTGTLEHGVITFALVPAPDKAAKSNADGSFAFVRSDFGPTPTKADIVGSWVLDIKAFEAEASAKIGAIIKATPNATPADAKTALAQLVKGAATAAVTFKADGSCTFTATGDQPKTGKWAIEDDMLLAEGPGSTIPFLASGHRLTTHMGPFIMTFVPAAAAPATTTAPTGTAPAATPAESAPPAALAPKP